MSDKGDADWASNTNEAVTVKIINPASYAKPEASSFHPEFTYPIFGEEESIFGYKGLDIEISFRAHDLYPNVQISYDEKFATLGDTQAMDVQAKLQEFLPSYAFSDKASFESRLKEENGSSFTPPGTLFHSYSRDGRDFEIWCGELTDPAVKLLLERMQIFVSFFVEGGVPLDLAEEEWSLARWRVFFAYEKHASPSSSNASPYTIVGYSTSYRFLTYVPQSPDRSTRPDYTLSPNSPLAISSLPNRSRISQFLILPTHQHAGHGSHLYTTMFNTLHSDPACIEITVEDPNEAFDDLRDYCDFKRLTHNGTFSQLRLKSDIDPRRTQRRTGTRVPTSTLLDRPLYDKLRARNKIAPRQYHRLVEMFLLSQIPQHSRQGGAARLTQRARASDPGDRALYYWRLLAKQRIYRQNKDVLSQFELPERINKLEDTLNGQLDDYERLLEIITKGLAKGEAANGTAPPSARDRGKRKVIDDEDEDEEGERDPKRAKSVAIDDG